MSVASSHPRIPDQETSDDGRVAREIRQLLQGLDRVVAPDIEGWTAPAGTLGAWVTAHFAVVGAFWVVAVSAAGAADWPRSALLVFWTTMLSGLPFRVGRWLQQGATSALPNASRLSNPDAKLGGAFTITAIALQGGAQFLGTVVFAAAVTTLLAVTALRIVAIDAWRSDERPRDPWFYPKWLLSLPGFLAAVMLVAGSALSFFLLGAVFDRLIAPGAQSSVEDIIGVRWSRTQQFRDVVVFFAVFALPTVLLSEGVSTVNRFEYRLRQRAMVGERAVERDRLRLRLHQTAIPEAKQLVDLTSSVDQRAVFERLLLHLRMLQVFDDSGPEERRPLKEFLRPALIHATHSGLKVTATWRSETMQLVPDPRVGQALATATSEFIANTIDQGIERASLHLAERRSGTIELRYFDDGPGFDGHAALAAGGGLAVTRRTLRIVGGTLEFADIDSRTTSIVRLPLELAA